ncbi:MAG: hypothetical protein JW719_13090, partial [Pirellulales bacterium]|nr:hypothetical protein [Pirellulales bacterium]
DSASSGQMRHAFAFAFAREPVELAIAAERRKPQVIVGQLLTMKIEDDTVQYEAVFRYNILYSGVKSLRIDVPETLAGKLRNNTPGIRERVVEPAPDDLPKGYQAWSFSGETELVGEGQITLIWEEKLDKLGLGDEVKVEVPTLTPAKADDAPIDRAWGQIVLVKAETIDLAPTGTPEGLRPIDPQRDLAGGAKVADAASAFEFHGPWSLTVKATRYELQDVKYTIIENAVARMVVTRADQIAVQAVYRLRSGRQRLKVTLPKDVIFDTEPLRINGRPVTLEKGGDNQFFIPLTESSAERPLLVDLRYTLPTTRRAGGGQVLSLPEFPEKPAIQKVRLCAYLPDERALIGVKGPWTNEIIWASDHTMNWCRPSYFHTDESLLEKLAEGIPMTSKPTEGFETDGRRYVFSTLRPTGPLRLIDVNETALTAIVLAVLLLGGLVLAAASIKVRVLAVGGLIAAVLLSGMFAPLFARQVLDGYFLAALVVVVVVWIVVMAIRLRPRRTPASAPPMPTPQPPTAPPPAPAAPAPTEAAAPADKASDSPFAPPANQTPDDEGGKKDA